MHPKELYGSQVVMKPVNPDGTYGEPITLDSFEPISIDGEPLETYPSDAIRFDLLANAPITFTGELTFPHKKMSRKTFKKWLMQYSWINRNSAEIWCCLIAVANGRVSYGRTYRDMILNPTFLGLIDSVVSQLKETEK